jgi:hypothetical protein
MAQEVSIFQRISKRRAAAISQGDKNASSNMDGDVQFNSVSAVIAYLLRAGEIGLFAPFPNMWLAAGNRVGLAGRLISGPEMTLTYIFQVGTCLALWEFRCRLAAGFVFLVTIFGILGLGLVIVNMGTLYRLRFPFWILFVVLGTAGILEALKCSAQHHRLIEIFVNW